jgi:hypothetical protein
MKFLIFFTLLLNKFLVLIDFLFEIKIIFNVWSANIFLILLDLYIFTGASIFVSHYILQFLLNL